MICKANCIHNFGESCELCDDELIGIIINKEGCCEMWNDYDIEEEEENDEE